jgi:hypothetical protein
MSIPGGANPLLLATAAAAAADFKISRSLRFNDDDTAFLSRTPSSAGNRQTWTWSAWVKRSNLGTEQVLWTAGADTNTGEWSALRFITTDQLQFINNTSNSTDINLLTTQVFRDSSAWFHILLRADITNGTANDRIDIYINGTKIDTYSTETQPGTTVNTGINGAQIHNIGREAARTNYYCDLYLADVYFIDGQALAPTDFGEYDDDNNWNPKAYDGTYGTNGFHLDFSDNSSNSALGTDAAGSNDWTVNNLVAAVAENRYSQTTTGTAPTPNSSNDQYIEAFDGSTSTAFYFNTGTWAMDWSSLPSSTTVSSSLRIYCYPRTGTLTVNINGSNVASITGNSETWRTVSFTGTINSISFTGTDTYAGVSAIEVDGSILTDYQITGAANDSLIDTPTNYDASSGNNGGNYCTLNPLDSNIGSNLTNGNLDAAGSSNWSAGHVRGTFGLTSGKWYWEVSRTGGSGATAQIGFCNKAFSLTTTYGSLPADSWTFAFGNGTEILRPSGGGTGYFSGSAMGVGDTVGIALDMDNKTAVFYKNGTAGASISLSSTKTGSTDNIDELFPLVGVYTANVAFNGGQRPFAISSIPTGYKALCTQNLTDPTIADGSTAMDVRSNLSAQFTINDLGFEPGLVVAKSTSHSEYWIVADKLRNFIGGLRWNDTNTEGSGNAITNVGAAGYQSDSNWFTTGRTYATFNWNAGTSTVSNTDGSITSNVRANQSAGFSIVTGSGNSGTVGHGLNAKPDLVIVKQRNGAVAWAVAHSGLGAMKDNIIYLNGTNANTTSSNFWGSSNFDSSVFPISSNICTSGATFVAYCFTAVEGYSAFGSYTGNGSSDGPFVHTGFRVAWLLTKRTDGGSNNWQLIDATRSSFNVADDVLKPDESSAESTHADYSVDFLSNGFKHRTGHIARNGSGNTYIYAAFAEHPFKTARAR